MKISDFLCAVHDVGAQRRRDAVKVYRLAKETRDFVAMQGLPDDDPDIASLLDACEAAERLAASVYAERPVSIQSLVRQPGIPAGAA